ncbi:MAG TPA: 6,7-dimethyl-8-ribityllumazine synthase [Nitrospirales bacterium]
MPTTIEGAGAATGLRFGIIRSRFNEDITKRLLEGALDALRTGGVREDAIDVVLVPGAFEIPLVASRLARSRRYDALICLGAVIRGETPHFEYISAEVSRGIAKVASDHGLPVIFGVLTTNTEEQAQARSGKEGMNRGHEAGRAAIEMATLMKRLDVLSGSIPRGRRRTTRRQSRKRAR